MTEITILGAGAFGTCLAVHAAKLGHEPTLWGRNAQTMATMAESRRHPTRLDHCELPDTLHVTSDLAAALETDLIIHAIPAQQTRAFWTEHRDLLREDAQLLLASKGLERETGERLDEVFGDVFDQQWVATRLAAISGPTFATEVARGVPSVALIAALNETSAETFQHLLAGPTFRLYRSTDLIGVEVAGAFKNVIAIAAGISDGLQLGLNTRAAIIARGLAEMTRFGVAQGADAATFSGLAGVGDLILTATGDLSRNRRVGLQIGQGRKLDAVLADMAEVAEGVPTTASVVQRAQDLQIEIPIAEQIHAILFAGKDPEKAVFDLMTRSLKREY